MQVKKFEAPTMKEALEMVKNHLGPGAIILNAKDNSRGFGLMGQKSIEITAAISEGELKKKQWAESRLKEEQILMLRQKSMKIQKEFIEKSVQRYTDNQEEEENKRRPPTQRRYIDIDDERENKAMTTQMAQAKTVEEILKSIGQSKDFLEPTMQNYASIKGPAKNAVTSDQRVKNAALSALRAFEEAEIIPETPKHRVQTTNSVSNAEVEALKNEILNLRGMIQNFQTAQSSNIQETMHPGSDKGVSFELSGIFHKLSQSGIADEHILRLLDLAKRELRETVGRQSVVEGWIAKHMMSEIKVSESADASPLQIFLGTTGSGKSASLIKLASHYVIHENKKVGILTADTEKVGAVEQLRTYAQILNVPFGILKKPEDWKSVIDSLRTLDYVLIDFPGNTLKEMQSIERFSKMLPPSQAPSDRHLVISSSFKDKDAFEIAERYRIAKPTDIIFSKLDEAVSHGLIYNFQKKFDLPLFSFGIGPQLPEDFEFATRERVIDLIFHLTKMKQTAKLK
jgi:flagellar biosynthesis protein FlhF